jgi:hypothetical protein
VPRIFSTTPLKNKNIAPPNTENICFTNSDSNFTFHKSAIRSSGYEGDTSISKTDESKSSNARSMKKENKFID